MSKELTENKYEEGILKEYLHWTLTISFKQSTLGSYIILAKRPNEQISDLTDEELLELRQVMKEIEMALTKADSFKPDRFNYLQLGNALHQLHFHGIPRYNSPRTFAGKNWIDHTYGSPPIFASEESSIALVVEIRDHLRLFM